MPTRIVISLSLLLLLHVASCSGADKVDVSAAIANEYQDVLENAETFELMTLACEQDELPKGADGSLFKERFRLIEVRSIEDESVRSALVNELYTAISRQEEKAAACFEPHHGIRARKGGVTVTILVCFMCHNFEVWPGGGNGGRWIDVASMKTWRSEVHRLGMLHVDGVP